MYLILTKANCESYLEKKLPSKAQKAFQDCKLLFGSRTTSGWQINSLKKELNTAIGCGSSALTLAVAMGSYLKMPALFCATKTLSWKFCGRQRQTNMPKIC